MVAKYIEELGLPTFPVDPPTVYVALHEDGAGVPKVAFVMNPEPAGVLATVSLGANVKALVDLLPRTREPARIEAKGGGFVIEVPARTARMFAVISAKESE